MNKVIIKSIRLSDELAARIDMARGDVSWSRWVELAILAALGKDPVFDTAEGPRRLSSVKPGEAIPVRAFPPREHLPTCGCAVCRAPK